MPELNQLESTIIELLLAGDDPTLDTLRHQLRATTVLSRDFTGAGFYTNFTVANPIERVEPKNFEITDVCAEITGLPLGAGFVLFVRGGVLQLLEGFSYGDDVWPADAVLTDAYYVHHEPADGPMLQRCASRDLGQLRQYFDGRRV